MSIRQLIEGDCGGVNPLMQLGGQFSRDIARKDEGFSGGQFERAIRPEDHMVNEFLGQMAAPPQSFQMGTLLQEMREIEHANAGMGPLQAAPRVIDEVTNEWSKEFIQGASNMQIVHMHPQQQQIKQVEEFFDVPGMSGVMTMPYNHYMAPSSYYSLAPPYQRQAITQGETDQFFEEGAVGGSSFASEIPKTDQGNSIESWLNDYETNKEDSDQAAANYSEKFWQRLQDEWQKVSEDSELPWLSEYNDNYEPYKEYEFAEENPLAELENAFEKGKEYLDKGDIPSAVLCFEVAAKKEPENAEIWQFLGIAQTENEMDPQSIAALKRSLELIPNNPTVLMALAVCYTNESLQSHALKMLTKWLQINPKYQNIVDKFPDLLIDNDKFVTSIIRGNRLVETQNMFLEAVRSNPQEIDADIQEALGVLYNLSSDFDKAVDCFRAALHVKPQNAKVWNRLGASLANGARSVEAVDAYQQALQLEPGFIRVRYNVGVCCMNLKAYQQSAEHLITALNMQANSAALSQLPSGSIGNRQKQMSDSIWQTLKMVISLMGRTDLQDFVTDHNLKGLNDAFKD